MGPPLSARLARAAATAFLGGVLAHAALLGAGWLGLSALPGCIPCDDPGYRLGILAGPLPVPAGGRLELTVEVIGGALHDGPRCDGYWLVDGQPGGSAADGTVSGCGVYTAPDEVASPRAVTITWSEFEPGSCTACCPTAHRRIDLTP